MYRIFSETSDLFLSDKKQNKVNKLIVLKILNYLLQTTN